MSDDPRRIKKGWFRVIEDISDPVELERLSALRPPDDGGAATIRSEAAGVLYSRERNGKPASAVPMILGLLELLTPEQMIELAERLPAQLSPEAKAKLAETAGHVLNGAKVPA